MSIASQIKRLFGKTGQRPAPLPRSTVTHDSVDEMVFGNFTDDSPRFRRVAVEDAPLVTPDVKDPDPLDFTTASPEDIKAWQEKARAAKAARANAPEYESWEDLTRDVFYSYHHHQPPEVKNPAEVDPEVAHHAKIMSKAIVEEGHAQARNLTRGDKTAAAMATMAFVGTAREALEDALSKQARQSHDMSDARESAENAMQRLESLRNEARELHEQGQEIPQDLRDAVQQAVEQKIDTQTKAAAIAENSPVPIDKAGHDAIVAAVAAAHQAAKNASALPSFGQGFGAGEPTYSSPEQALTIADMWANNKLLNAVAERYGRLKLQFFYERANRVEGGADEIVDIVRGDDLRRLVPAELPYLADDEFEDDFYTRYLSADLLNYSTVGEEHAGRGPVIVIGDESYSMNGERLIWMKALCLCLLAICRREKRDFAYVGFASAGQVYSYTFLANQPMDAEAVVEVASHFFKGGTSPILGVARGEEIMSSAREFRKADIVLVGDGDAGFGGEDQRLRDLLESRGVRLHGVGIGGEKFRYLNSYCGEANVIAVSDFELEDPSGATAHLATHIT